MNIVKQPDSCTCDAAGVWGATGVMPDRHWWRHTASGGYLAHRIVCANCHHSVTGPDHTFCGDELCHCNDHGRNVSDCATGLTVSRDQFWNLLKTCSCPEHGDWISATDVNRLVREMDVALNGEEGAAPQAALCDITSQVVHKVAPMLKRAESTMKGPFSSLDERSAARYILNG